MPYPVFRTTESKSEIISLSLVQISERDTIVLIITSYDIIHMHNNLLLIKDK